MTYASRNILQPPHRAGIMHCRVTATLLVLLCLAAQSAMAQDKPAPKSDDLDVTMQIITDPDAKLPDEVVRQIPLPPRKPSAATATKATDAADKSQEREAKELGKETAERAKERAKDAAEQREQAARSKADEHRRNPDPPKPPPPRRPR